MSQPVAVSSAICWRVALTSAVSVVVIDWTETGESLPTPTLPTWIWRVLRRGASTGGGAAGIPRLISVMASSVRRGGPPPPIRAGSPSGLEVEGYDEVADDQHQAHRRAGTTPRRRRSAAAWRRRRNPGSGRPRSRANPRRTASQSAPAMWPPSRGSSGMKLNIPMKKLKPAISISRKTAFSVTGKPSCGHRLAREPAAADDADRAVRVALLDADDRLGHAPHLHRQGGQRLDGLDRHVSPSAAA